MKKKMSLAKARADWQKAIRDQLAAAKGDPIRAASLAGKKHPELRAAVVKAANPKKKVQDEDLEDDLEAEDTELEDEEVDEEELLKEAVRIIEDRKKREGSSKKSDSKSSYEAMQNLWQSAIRSEMNRSKCDNIKAACTVAKQYPNLRRKLVAAANRR